MTDMYENWLSVKTVSRRLKTSDAVVYQLIRCGKLRSKKHHGRLYIRVQSMLEYQCRIRGYMTEDEIRNLRQFLHQDHGQSELLSTADVAEILGISLSKTYRSLKTGKLVGRIGKGGWSILASSVRIMGEERLREQKWQI